MIPYHDENKTQRTAVVTLVLIALCIAAWFQVQGAGASRSGRTSGDLSPAWC